MGQRRSVVLPIALGVTGSVLFALALLLWLQNAVVVAPQLDSYAVVDARTLLVRVYVTPCGWTRVDTVAETATAVRVGVETLPCPLVGAGSDSLDIRELTVGLATEVGARTVEDANGQSIPSR